MFGPNRRSTDFDKENVPLRKSAAPTSQKNITVGALSKFKLVSNEVDKKIDGAKKKSRNSLGASKTMPKKFR
jgi:hypothetical protein